jgi:osmoprotectant transport system permease protein
MNAVWRYLTDNGAQITDWTVTTVILAVAPLAAGLVISVPVGWLAVQSRVAGATLVPVAKVLYTIPSLVLFLFLPSILGTKILDPVNVAVALTVYTVALLAPATADGLRSVPSELMDAAAAMGQSTWQRFWALQLPIALPVLGAAVRVAAVSNVALISVASVIGVAQLGQLFVVGNTLGNLAPIILGLAAFIILALLLDAAIVAATRTLTPWRHGVSR